MFLMFMINDDDYLDKIVLSIDLKYGLKTINLFTN